MVKGQWLTQTEYARAKGITKSAVEKAITSGRLETNGKSGRDCRVRERTTATNLETARIEKIKADIEIQKMKLAETVDAIRRECFDAILEEYQRAFAPVKVRLIELHLGAAQTSSLRKIFSSCAETFLLAARERLTNGGRRDEQEK